MLCVEISVSYLKMIYKDNFLRDIFGHRCSSTLRFVTIYSHKPKQPNILFKVPTHNIILCSPSWIGLRKSHFHVYGYDVCVFRGVNTVVVRTAAVYAFKCTRKFSEVQSSCSCRNQRELRHQPRR